ncbi:DUF6705 family protein [Chryseobacterium echinoideorum]|uniref:DUF6705 family protein n=1 Tax=Chryseobacterium echinoideorum TaxID=1549648 RepID=UPI001184D429|nr:DUF6705 family protein [Chryseobacterium echinoideorum]
MRIRIAILIIIFTVSCKAQVVSLEQMSQCESDDCPDYTYAKDTNNLLNKFVGVWKGSYTDGRTYEFHFTKKEHDGGWFNEKFWDKIVGKFLVKDANGNILYNGLNLNDLDAIGGLSFDKNLKMYEMYFVANADCNDNGRVFIYFPYPNNLNQMRLVFMQDIDFVITCPSNYKTVIPDAKPIMLTKQ